MPPARRTKAALAGDPGAGGARAARSVRAVLASLEQQGRKKFREDMATRYGIVVKKAWGVPMGAVQKIARGLGKDHELALALWDTGWYDARSVGAYVDDPALGAPA